MKNDLKGVIDIHIHIGPEAYKKRKYNEYTLAQEASDAGARALVMKAHIFETATRAKVAQEKFPNIQLFGGIALNEEVGGLNAAAVRAVADLGGKIVWFPTLAARHEKQQMGKEGGICCFEEGSRDKLSKACESVLNVIAEKQLVLATGHISIPEQIAVVREAHNLGIKHILINHPTLFRIGMDVRTQESLLKYGVIFERNYGGSRLPESKVFEKHFERNLRDIRYLGAESSIMATDLGQPFNCGWAEGFQEYIDFMYDHGVSEKDIDLMTRKNPAALLGI